MPSIQHQAPSRQQQIAVSIILPTYNEHDNLPILAYLLSRELTRSPYVSGFELLIVDDASPDGTGQQAARLADPRTNGGLFAANQVSVLRRSGKQGLGSAYRHALASARHPYVAILDADLSHHPRHLSAMAQRALDDPSADIVCGSRYIAGGGVAGWTLARKTVSRGANFLAEWLLRPGVSDLTGSFRLYRREALERLMGEIVTKGYTFQMEIMVRARRAGMRIVEVPVCFVDRQFGESKLGGGEIVGYLRGLWHLFVTV